MRIKDVTLQRRRGFLGTLMAALAAPLLGPGRARGQESIESIVPAVKDITRGAPARPGRVRLEMPLLADNGHSVPLKVTVQSPMTDADHVRGIAIVSERNPRPVVARFQLGPRAGRAQIVTRIRLAGSQRVVAIAAMSDGSYWYGTSEVNVTESACLDTPENT
jgi:sulfur-oxidizing protein SoxY